MPLAGYVNLNMETMSLPIYVALFDALKLVQGSQEFVQTYQGIVAG